MIGSDQPSYHTMARIKQASMSCGYRFKAVSWESKLDSLRLRLTNVGVAPLHRDAHVTAGADTAKVSLKGLLPGDTLEFKFRRGISAAYQVTPRIVCRHCVPGQSIQIEADLSEGTSVIAHAGRAGDVQWRQSPAGWSYRTTNRVFVAVNGLDGRLLWRGALPSTSGRWAPAPFGSQGIANRFVVAEETRASR